MGICWTCSGDLAVRADVGDMREKGSIAPCTACRVSTPFQPHKADAGGTCQVLPGHPLAHPYRALIDCLRHWGLAWLSALFGAEEVLGCRLRKQVATSLFMHRVQRQTRTWPVRGCRRMPGRPVDRLTPEQFAAWKAAQDAQRGQVRATRGLRARRLVLLRQLGAFLGVSKS